MKLFVGSALCFASLVSLGCRSISGSDSSDIVITTDQSSYRAAYLGGTGFYKRYGFTVVARIENRGTRPAYLGLCYPTSNNILFNVEMADRASNAESAYGQIWACVGHDVRPELAPGEVRVETVFVSGPNAISQSSGPTGNLTGRMRMQFAVNFCAKDEQCPGRADGYSNAFDVELAQ